MIPQICIHVFFHCGLMGAKKIGLFSSNVMRALKHTRVQSHEGEHQESAGWVYNSACPSSQLLKVSRDPERGKRKNKISRIMCHRAPAHRNSKQRLCETPLGSLNSCNFTLNLKLELCLGTAGNDWANLVFRKANSFFREANSFFREADFVFPGANSFFPEANYRYFRNSILELVRRLRHPLHL